MRRLAAHHAGVGLDDEHRQLQPPEDRQIGLDDPLVPGVEVLLAGVEAVGVLHQELAQAHEAATRARLVAELALDLIDQLRKLAIGLDDGAREVGDGLLVRHRQHHRMLGAILEPREVAADGVVAPRLLPELRRLHDRQQDLLPADAVHLLADDGLDVVDGANGERGQTVDAAGDAARQPCAQDELVARQLGLGGDALLRLEHTVGHAHWWYLLEIRGQTKTPTPGKRARARTRGTTFSDQHGIRICWPTLPARHLVMGCGAL